MTSAPTTFLVEHYWPGITPDQFEEAAARVRASTLALAANGVGIRFLHSTLVPEDEAAFCVFDAESQAAVEEAYAQAGVPYERVLDALEIGVNRNAPAADAAGQRKEK